MRGRAPKSNPVAAAVLRATIMRHVKELYTAADLQAWNGAHWANLINTSGRLVFIVLGAAPPAGFAESHPDIRVCLGMGSALADLTTDRDIERHRPAIRAGLAAIDRLMPHLKAEALFEAAAQLDAMIKGGEDIDTDALRALVHQQETVA